MTSSNNNTDIDKSNSWKMFNRISSRYDFLNHLFSFGLDIHWRKKLAKLLRDKKNQQVLDLASGTADVLLSLLTHNHNIQSGYGIDLADNMLAIGRKKVQRRGLENNITLQHGDANQINFDANTFDAVTMAFGIRNVDNPNQVLNEIYRVLNSQGRALILEFSLPSNKIIRVLHLFYLRNIIPFLAGIFSKDKKAYQYLNKTIESFPYGDQFCQLMKKSGFRNIKTHVLMFGIASIYQGEK